MKIESASFQGSATRPEDEPRTPGPDVLFVGRSNVGKSSLINRLLKTPGLARTSSTPGRTQTVNFYRINGSFHFVDFPGYGFAKVPERIRVRWRPMVESFLDHRRRRVRLAVLLVDARHRPTELDRTMKRWLEWREFPFLVVATKADKLSGNGRTRSAKAIREELGPWESEDSLVLASARTGLGMTKIWKRLDRALA